MRTLPTEMLQGGIISALLPGSETPSLSARPSCAMRLLTFCLILTSITPGALAQDPPVVVPPTKKGRITLPGQLRVQGQQQAGVARIRNDAAQFHRDVIDLRRSKFLKPQDEEALMQILQRDYDKPAAMAVALAATSRADLVYGLMKVVDRFGEMYNAEELHFQVLTKPLGQATERVIQTIVRKSGGSAKEKLLDYLSSKYTPVRQAAVKLLPPLLSEEDVPRILALTRDRKSDIRRKAVQVSVKMDSVELRARLLQMLQQDSGVAGEVCRALIASGPRVVPDLVEIVENPARSRAFGYAAFALVTLERQQGSKYLTQQMIPHLRRELTGDDSMLRATSALALGTLVHRSSETSDDDAAIVEGLVLLVAPDDFVTGLKLFQPAAVDFLERFSGQRELRGQAWRGWWESNRDGFSGLRGSLEITSVNGDRSLLLWSAGEYFLAFHGEEFPSSDLPVGCVSYILTAEQMVEIVTELRGLGFMSDLEPPIDPNAWSLDLSVGSSRVSGRFQPDGRGVAIHRSVAAVAYREMWQQYRDASTHPDVTEFWREELRWRQENPDERDRRLVERILSRLPALDHAGRDRALSDLQTVRELSELITEADGVNLVEIASSLEEIDTSDFRLLEVALIAPGNLIWRRALEVLDLKTDGTSAEVSARLFRLLGMDRVVIAIQHPSRAVALAAMQYVAATNHQAAVPALMERMVDADLAVRQTSIYALGTLKADEARQALIEQELEAPPGIKRELWIALARIGGPGVMTILRRASTEPDLDDRRAALAAMGHTKSSEMAEILAARFANRGAELDVLAQQAEVSLRQLGTPLAIPALQPHLQMENGDARRQIVLLLGEFNDPMVVLDLIDLQRDPRSERLAARFLSETTGVDLRDVNNRIAHMNAWFAQNRSNTQAAWYVAALRRAQVPTSLSVFSLSPGSGVAAVPELTRLLVAIKDPHLVAMTGAMLRSTSGEDFTRGIRNAGRSGLTAIAERYKIHAATIQAIDK